MNNIKMFPYGFLPDFFSPHSVVQCVFQASLFVCVCAFLQITKGQVRPSQA